MLTLNTGFAATSNSTNTTTSKLEGSGQKITNTTSKAAAGPKPTIKIKVLVYNGPYTIANCVNGIKIALKTATTKKLVPGYTFSVSTSKKINSATLTGYDVLAMPGGSSGYDYMHTNNVNSAAIKKFVKSGKGYLGICAGAYSGSYHVQGYYYGWNLAPHIKLATHPNHEGPLTMKMTAKGQKITNVSGTLKIAHYNGPAYRYVNSPAFTFSTYADNIIHSKNYAAIVGDYYGKGRTVLSGPHPELSPRHPKLLAGMVVWVAHKTKPDPTNIASRAQIASAAGSVVSYYNKNKRLPSKVTVNGFKVSMPQFSYLLTKGIAYTNSGITASVLIKNVKTPSKYSRSNKSGNISKSRYLTLAKSMVNYINKNGKPSRYQSTTLGKISFNKLVYMYSKIMNFYKSKKRLPNYVSL